MRLYMAGALERGCSSTCCGGGGDGVMKVLGCVVGYGCCWLLVLASLAACRACIES